MATPTISTTQPETLRQAQRFEEYRNHYVNLGLCYRCSAQAAYGHQHGFSQVHQPCAGCEAVVKTFPKEETNRWKSKSPDGRERSVPRQQ